MNILLIGNSFSARNDLLGLVTQLAEAHGDKFQHHLISAGGASLRRHWNKGDALKAIRETRYDFVVLQEQSTLPIKNPSRMHENIRLFHQVIEASGAKTGLYLTWARQNAPETQKAIANAYTAIGEELEAVIIPVGIAWQTFMSKYRNPVLHDIDKSHPTLAGSYLAACVFYAVLFKKSPIGVVGDIEGLTRAEADLLQTTALAVLRK